MGFFNKENIGGGELAPLTNDRIIAALEELEWLYDIDDDGEIGAGWEEGFFYFLRRGSQEEILHIRGIWHPRLTSENLAEADAFCAEWNRSTLWPKAYTVSFDDGVVRVACENNVDYEHGVSHKQIMQQIACAVSTGCEFFSKLDEAFPEQRAAWQAERAEHQAEQG